MTTGSVSRLVWAWWALSSVAAGSDRSGAGEDDAVGASESVATFVSACSEAPFDHSRVRQGLDIGLATLGLTMTPTESPPTEPPALSIEGLCEASSRVRIRVRVNDREVEHLVDLSDVGSAERSRTIVIAAVELVRLHIVAPAKTPTDSPEPDGARSQPSPPEPQLDPPSTPAPAPEDQPDPARESPPRQETGGWLGVGAGLGVQLSAPWVTPSIGPWLAAVVTPASDWRTAVEAHFRQSTVQASLGRVETDWYGLVLSATRRPFSHSPLWLGVRATGAHVVVRPASRFGIPEASQSDWLLATSASAAFAWEVRPWLSTECTLGLGYALRGVRFSSGGEAAVDYSGALATGMLGVTVTP